MKRFGLLCLCLIFLSVFPSDIKAQSEAIALNTPGLDVVLLIENTNRVGLDGNNAFDYIQVRQEFISYVGQILVADALYLNPDAQHTLSVLPFDFGDHSDSEDEFLRFGADSNYMLIGSPNPEQRSASENQTLYEQQVQTISQTASEFDTLSTDGVTDTGICDSERNCAPISAIEGLLGIPNNNDNREQIVIIVSGGKFHSTVSEQSLRNVVDSFSEFMNGRFLDLFTLPINTRRTNQAFQSNQEWINLWQASRQGRNLTGSEFWWDHTRSAEDLASEPIGLWLESNTLSLLQVLLTQVAGGEASGRFEHDFMPIENSNSVSFEMPYYVSSAIFYGFGSGFHLNSPSGASSIGQSFVANGSYAVFYNPPPGEYRLENFTQGYVVLQMGEGSISVPDDNGQWQRSELSLSLRDIFGTVFTYPNLPPNNARMNIRHQNGTVWQLGTQSASQSGQQSVSFVNVYSGSYTVSYELSPYPDEVVETQQRISISLGSSSAISYEANPISLSLSSTDSDLALLIPRTLDFSIQGTVNQLAVTPLFTLAASETGLLNQDSFLLQADSSSPTNFQANNVQAILPMLQARQTIDLSVEATVNLDSINQVAPITRSDNQNGNSFTFPGFFNFRVSAVAPTATLTVDSDQPVLASTHLSLSSASNTLPASVLRNAQAVVCAHFLLPDGTDQDVPLLEAENNFESEQFRPTRTGPYVVSVALKHQDCTGSVITSLVENQTFTVQPLSAQLVDENNLPISTISQFLPTNVYLVLSFSKDGQNTFLQNEEAVHHQSLYDELELAVTFNQQGIGLHREADGRYRLELPAQELVTPLQLVLSASQISNNAPISILFNEASPDTQMDLSVTPVTVSATIEPMSLGARQFSEATIQIQIRSANESQSYDTDDFSYQGGTIQATLEVNGAETEVWELPAFTFVEDENAFVLTHVPLPLGGNYELRVALIKAGQTVLSTEFPVASLNVTPLQLAFVPSESAGQLVEDQCGRFTAVWQFEDGTPVTDLGENPPLVSFQSPAGTQAYASLTAIERSSNPEAGDIPNPPVQNPDANTVYVCRQDGSVSNINITAQDNRYIFYWRTPTDSQDQETLQLSWTTPPTLMLEASGHSEPWILNIGASTFVYFTVNGNSVSYYHPAANFWRTSLSNVLAERAFVARLAFVGESNRQPTGTVYSAEQVLGKPLSPEMIEVTLFNVITGEAILSEYYSWTLSESNPQFSRLFVRVPETDIDYRLSVNLRDETTVEPYQLRPYREFSQLATRVELDQSTNILPLIAIILAFGLASLAFVIWVILRIGNESNPKNEQLSGFLRLVDTDGTLLRWQEPLNPLRRKIWRFKTTTRWAIAEMERMHVYTIPNAPEFVMAELWFKRRKNLLIRLQDLTFFTRSKPQSVLKLELEKPQPVQPGSDVFLLFSTTLATNPLAQTGTAPRQARVAPNAPVGRAGLKTVADGVPMSANSQDIATTSAAVIQNPSAGTPTVQEVSSQSTAPNSGSSDFSIDDDDEFFSSKTSSQIQSHASESPSSSRPDSKLGRKSQHNIQDPFAEDESL